LVFGKAQIKGEEGRSCCNNMRNKTILAIATMLIFILSAPVSAQTGKTKTGRDSCKTEVVNIELEPLIVSEYHLTNKKFTAPLSIIMISDFHDRLHGRSVSEIVARVAHYKPDLILMPGDIFERVEETIATPTIHPFIKAWRSFIAMPKESYDTRNARKLIAELGKLAPVYISRGNHELYYLPQDILAIVNANATLLDNYDKTVTVKGMTIRIGGLSTNYDILWMERFSKKDGIKILLSHNPEYYTDFIKGTEQNTFDLIVSGHAHGGQWRIFDRGVYSPGQGIFPVYTKGKFGNHIISTGISNSVAVRRIRNPKEMVYIKIN